jgi:hypothetical protein
VGLQVENVVQNKVPVDVRPLHGVAAVTLRAHKALELAEVISIGGDGVA